MADETASLPNRERDATAAPAAAGGLRFARDQLVAGRYRVGGLLGRGGMGEVYRVTDTAIGIDVALKTLPGQQPIEDTETLRREIRHGRTLAHRNVCRMFDLGSHEGLEFVTMELLEGETLADRLARVGRIKTDEALPLLRQIAAGLGAMHEVGIVHRDFKPGNVMLVGDRAIVTDFGLARLLGAATSHAGSETIAAGTPAYMAPEQLRGEPATERTDVYAFGIVAYEVLAGRVPFLGDTPAATAMMRLACTPPRLADPHCDRVLRRALARAPADRCASPLDVIAALERRPVRRWPRRALLAAAVAAVTLGGVYGAWLTAQNERTSVGLPAPLIAFSGPNRDNLDQVVAIGDDLVIAGKGSRGARLGDRVLTNSNRGEERSGMVARVRADGGVRWLREVSGPEDVRVNAAAVSSDGRVAIGGFHYGPARSDRMELPDPTGVSDGFVMMLDGETGELLWWRSFPATTWTSVRSLAFDAGGALYAAGELAGTARFADGVERTAEGASSASGEISPYVASWERDGTLRWVTAGSGAAQSRLHSISVDGGEVIAAGTLSGKTMIGGLQLQAEFHHGCLLRIDAATGDVRSGRLLHGNIVITAAVPAAAGAVIIGGRFSGTYAARSAQPHDRRQLLRRWLHRPPVQRRHR